MAAKIFLMFCVLGAIVYIIYTEAKRANEKLKEMKKQKEIDDFNREIMQYEMDLKRAEMKEFYDREALKNSERNKYQ